MGRFIANAIAESLNVGLGFQKIIGIYDKSLESFTARFRVLLGRELPSWGS